MFLSGLLFSLGEFSHFRILAKWWYSDSFSVRGVKFFSEEGNPDKDTPRRLTSLYPLVKRKFLVGKIPNSQRSKWKGATTKEFLNALKVGSTGCDKMDWIPPI